VVKRGVFTEIIMRDSAKTDSFFFRCPVKGQVNFPPPGPALFSTLGFSGERI
jgi:hypothetical protein